MANGFSKLNPGNPSVETESDVYRRQYRRRNKAEKLMDLLRERAKMLRIPKWHGTDTGTEREIPTWRRRKFGEQEDV